LQKRLNFKKQTFKYFEWNENKNKSFILFHQFADKDK